MHLFTLVQCAGLPKRIKLYNDDVVIYSVHCTYWDLFILYTVNIETYLFCTLYILWPMYSVHCTYWDLYNLYTVILRPTYSVHCKYWDLCIMFSVHIKTYLCCTLYILRHIYSVHCKYWDLSILQTVHIETYLLCSLYILRPIYAAYSGSIHNPHKRYYDRIWWYGNLWSNQYRPNLPSGPSFIHSSPSPLPCRYLDT